MNLQNTIKLDTAMPKQFKSRPSIGVAIITHNARKHLTSCLQPILTSPLNPRILVVNSSSEDGTLELAKELGVETLVIPRKEFNHGLTRELARKTLNTDIIVMMTPDAYAKDRHVLGKLVAPLLSKKASISYARQIPHEGSGFFESYAREYNYPQKGHIRGIKDAKTYGVYTFFCSNSCAAYSNLSLDSIGGFEPVLMGEDTLAVAKLLRQGHKISYTADAIVKHSHRYHLSQEFRRHFDTGFARAKVQKMIFIEGSDAKRGKQYVFSMLKRLAGNKPWLIPYALMQTLVKFIGYQIGCRGAKMPLWIKKKFTSQDFYWTSNIANLEK